MIDFVQLQRIVQDRLEQDRKVRTITANGATLEDSVAEAAVLLNIPVRHIEYEIIEKGSSGFLGSGKKSWTIKAYERLAVKKKTVIGGGEEIEISEETIQNVNASGEVFIHLSTDGAYLKAVPPRGNGRRASGSEAVELLHQRHIKDYDKDLVLSVVDQASGEFIWVADFEHKPVNDSMVTVDIAEGEMKAFITVTPPGIGGCDVSIETYMSFLRNNRITFGINEEHLKRFADRPVFREKVLVAEGQKAVNGQDAYIQYNFETEQSRVKLREGSNGRIDFKDLNIINNVVENQPLAKKMPPERGIAGRTVTGKMIPAKDGRDIQLPLGKNVHVGDNGDTVIADINGQVVVSGGKVNVEPIYTVQGAVNLKTGNIIFLGTVIINGNVEDGFSVKAAGNIEVNGTVERAELDAEGDIIVHQGITGKGTGIVRAGRSIWARFIENTLIEAGDKVVVQDGIINSQVNALNRIVCSGKRAHIVGGRLRASEEINAKILGSSTSGTETICEVGVDPKSKAQLESLFAKKSEMERQLEEVQLNVQTLTNIKKQRKSLPEEKEASLRELMDRRQIMMADLQKNAEEILAIQEYHSKIKTRCKISASSKVYPGVKIIIRDEVSDVRTEYKAVSFILEDGLVRVTKYEEPDESAKRGPDGYTAN